VPAAPSSRAAAFASVLLLAVNTMSWPVPPWYVI
jgi:hypothetical protein